MADIQTVPTLHEFHLAVHNGGNRWYAVALRITRTPVLAEEAVQDGLLSAWSKRQQFRDNAKLDTWIHRIIVNAALQLLRRQRPQSFDELEENTLSDPETQQHEQLQRELDDELQRALLKLTEVERVCFVLRHLEQWRLQEIADEMDCNLSRIKQALFRAVKKLRQHLAHWQEDLQ